MTIATLNLDGLKYLKEITEIITILVDLNADTLVLIEYDEKVNLKNYPFQIATKSLAKRQLRYYKSSKKNETLFQI